MHSLLLAVALLALPALALAQGSLTPAGAPAPTMRTLAQIEPRVPLQAGAPSVAAEANGGFTITAPGSYYLTSSIAVASGNAITITCNDVTLDLNGFTLSSTAYPPAGTGIELSLNLTHVTIRNGHISGSLYLSSAGTAGPGFDRGIYAWGMLLNDIVVEDVTVQSVASAGIDLTTLTNVAKTTIARRCSVSTSGGRGIEATQVIDCAADNCRGDAIASRIVLNSYGSSLSGYGIGAATVETSYGRSNTGGGITAGSVGNSYGYCYGDARVYPETGYGITAEVATNSYGGTYSGKAAIKATGTASFCYGDYPGHPAITGMHAFACVASGMIGTTNQEYCH